MITEPVPAPHLGANQPTQSARALTCQVLARCADRLPPAVRTRLGQIAAAAQDHAGSFFDDVGEGMPSGQGAMAALAAATGHADLLTTLLETTGPDRVWAIRLASRLDSYAAVGVLAALAHGDESVIRAEAAGSLARIVVTGSENPLALATLRRCLEDSGTRVARHVAGVLASHPPNVMTNDLVRQLSIHRSAAVREAIAGTQAQ